MKEMPDKDIWYQWLLHRRFGGDPKQMHDMAAFHAMRDEVLGHANPREGEVLLDAGCGDGLIAFGALEKTKTVRVIFSDRRRWEVAARRVLDGDLPSSQDLRSTIKVAAPGPGLPSTDEVATFVHRR